MTRHPAAHAASAHPPARHDDPAGIVAERYLALGVQARQISKFYEVLAVPSGRDHSADLLPLHHKQTQDKRFAGFGQLVNFLQGYLQQRIDR